MSFAFRCRPLVLSLALVFPLLQAVAAPPAISASPYPGTITLQVDATDLDHRIFRVQERLPVKPGPLTLFFPRWLPGHHSPTGDVSDVAGLQISAQGRPVAWRRDPLDTHAFLLEVPRGVDQLDIRFETLTPFNANSGDRVVMTPAMLNLEWNEALLYPAGHEAKAITVQAAMTLPEGWRYGTALRAAQQVGAQTQFEPVSLEMLVDSPVFAGKYLQRIELDPPGHERPVVLHLVADREEQLKTTPEQIEAHRALVQQADKLYGARHYAHYDFLLALSDVQSGIGLEHHQSSENGVKPDYLKDWDKAVGDRTLLPHEYTHSWNGKFRRPADLTTPNYNVPMQNSLLWVYEGQTQYWGDVLAARSGLIKPELMRDELAKVAAYLEARAGRTWRNLQDTTNEAIMTVGHGRNDWNDQQRSADYYDESALIWLDADTLIREKTGGQRSLDDFARAFFGVRNGELGPLTYRFEDVVATLNGVLPYDWTGFLRQRLDTHGPGAPLDGLTRSGWRLVYREAPGADWKADEEKGKFADFSYALGLRVAEDGKLASVAWDGPAYRAGLAPQATLLAVNGSAYKPELLSEAITANKGGQAPIELLVRDGERFRSIRIDYRGGLRYPALERIEGSEDRLSAVLAPR